MANYPDTLVKQVRQIHSFSGLTYSEISRKFDIPSGTIRNWCHEDGLSRKDALTRIYQLRRDLIKSSELSCVPNIGRLSKSQAKLLAGLLYGCEGSKYPASNRVCFTNSDPNLVTTFSKLLIKGFSVDPQKFSARLQIHADQSHRQLKNFWSRILGMSNLKFGKPTITSPLGGKHRLIYYGTCSLRYNDYRLQLKLLGIFEKFIGANGNKTAKTI